MPTRTDITVVASAYDTGGNSGHKVVKLSNGWFVAVDFNGVSSVYLQVSKDNGVTYIPLCFCSDVWGVKSVSLVNRGTDVYLIKQSATTGTALESIKINVLTVTNIDVNTTKQTVDSGQSVVEMMASMIINDAGTEAHAAWASKNSTYANSFNIRYAKGIINASTGVLTWGTVLQITAGNNASNDYLNPSISVMSNGYPVITFSISGTIFGTGIKAMYWNGASFASSIIYDSGSTSYPQNNPSVIFVPQSINLLTNGRIWVSWQGKDSTDTAVDNIRLAYSNDGGATWTVMPKVTSGNVNPQQLPTLTVNKSNKLFIVWNGVNTTWNVRKISYYGTTWSAISDVVTNAYSPSTLYDATFDFAEPLFIYKGSSKVGFYGTWTIASISVTQGDIGTKSDKESLFPYVITTDGAMSDIIEKINGVTIATKTVASGAALVVAPTQAQWDAIKYGKYDMPTTSIAPFTSLSSDWEQGYWAGSTLGGAVTASVSTNYLRNKIGMSVLGNTAYSVGIVSSSISAEGTLRIIETDSSGNVTKVNTLYSSVTTITTASATRKLYVYFSKIPVSTITASEVSSVVFSSIPTKTVIQNTLTITMGADTWTYTFDKRLAVSDDLISAVKAVQDAQNVFYPSIKAKLAAVIRGKGGTVNDADSWSIIESSLIAMSAKQTASGSITTSSASTSVVNYDGTNRTTAGWVAFNMANLPFIPSVIKFTRTDKSILSIAGIWNKDNFYVAGANYANVDASGTLQRAPYVNGVVNIAVVVGVNVSLDWVAYE